MRCPYCGNMISEEDRFCPFCNEQVNDDSDDFVPVDLDDDDYQSSPDDFEDEDEDFNDDRGD